MRAGDGPQQFGGAEAQQVLRAVETVARAVGRTADADDLVGDQRVGPEPTMAGAREFVNDPVGMVQ